MFVNPWHKIRQKAASDPKKLIFADGEDPRTIVLGTPVGVPVDRTDTSDQDDVEITAKPSADKHTAEVAKG